MKLFRQMRGITLLVLTVMFCGLALSGCAEMGLGGSDEERSSDSSRSDYTDTQPYYPTDFKDLLIPSELTWKRENSMSISTESFAGGILNFTGRVEVNSLTDFFISSMQKNGWRMVGSAKYKKIMLAFTKPYKTCMFSIAESEFGLNTEVNVYITEDISARKGQLSPSVEVLP